MNDKAQKKSGFMRFLDGVEYIGNKLPAPALIFVYLTLGVMIISAIMDANGAIVIHPGTGDEIYIRNLLTMDSLHHLIGTIGSNFQGFPPLALVLTVMIGAGFAEKVGWLETLMKKNVVNVNPKLLTVSIFTIGMLSNVAGDAGYLVLPPLAAITYMLAGRNPLIGVFVAYASVAGGLSANVVPAMLDVLLAGFTVSAAQAIEPDIVLNPTMNWFFMIASTVALIGGGTIITEKMVAPRLESLGWDKNVDSSDDMKLREISAEQLKALKAANISVLVYVVFMIFLAVAPIHNGQAFLAGSTGSLIDMDSGFLRGLVPIITALFFIPALTYGKVIGSIKNSHDAARMISSALSDMGGYLLIAFCASQFIGMFNWSRMGIIFSVNGAEALSNMGLTGGLLFVLFIILTALTNLFIGSASAQWAIFAPIFVPMFMLMGYEPAITQAAFRIGDSITNMIGPLASFFPLVLGLAVKYKKGFGIGSFISTMLPYTIFLGILWTIVFLIFLTLGLPFGV